MESEQLCDIQARLCRAMGNPVRVQILDALRDGPLSVGQIAAAMQQPVTAVSQNLAVLRNAGILVARRERNNILYHIANPKLMRVCDLMRELLKEQVDERARIMSSADE